MLKNVFIFLLFICSFLSIHFTEANEANEAIHSEMFQKKYNVSICTIFKNQTPYLKEWIEYHRIFGIDHFYLYNIGSTDSFKDILKPYTDEGIITLINWPEAINEQKDSSNHQWALSTQIPAYENAVNIVAKDETKWLVLLDVNEFLVCPEGKKISDLLNKYESYAGLSISADFYDASIDNDCEDKKLVIQSVHLVKPPKRPIGKAASKMLMKLEQCTCFTWPPYQCRFQEGECSFDIDREELRINTYINKNCKNEKMRNWADVDNRVLLQEDTLQLLKEDYVIEDKARPIYEHVPVLLEKLESAG